MILNIVHIIIGNQKIFIEICVKFFIFSGYDIGNHFSEFMFDYVSSKEWPFFKVDFSLYPNKTQQVKLFINLLNKSRFYLD